MLRLEQERIFRRSWQYVGVAADVAEPGTVLHVPRRRDVPVVVLRDREGELRAFVNVCRHRGHEIVSGCGRRETLQCPYHAWTYGLDGSLRAAPRSDREPGFDAGDWSLLPVLVDTWGPLVFVNPDAGGSAARRDARRPAAGRPRARARSRRARVPRALPRAGGRGELEARGRELPRVLPLPGRAQELQPPDRRRSGLVRARDGHVDARASSAPSTRGSTRATARDLPYVPGGADPLEPVPLRLAQLDAQHVPRPGQPARARVRARRARSGRGRTSTASGRRARPTR